MIHGNAEKVGKISGRRGLLGTALAGNPTNNPYRHIKNRHAKTTAAHDVSENGVYNRYSFDLSKLVESRPFASTFSAT